MMTSNSLSHLCDHFLFLLEGISVLRRGICLLRSFVGAWDASLDAIIHGHVIDRRLVHPLIMDVSIKAVIHKEFLSISLLVPPNAFIWIVVRSPTNCGQGIVLGNVFVGVVSMQLINIDCGALLLLSDISDRSDELGLRWLFGRSVLPIAIVPGSL